MKEWQKELYIYRLSPAPPKKDDLQEYIDLYLAEKDETYLSWFLHYYEPTLNTTVMGVVQRYSMFGHFLDIKEACVLGILRALEEYPKDCDTPFITYKTRIMWEEIHNYIRTMRTGFTVQSDDEYRNLRNIMRLFTAYNSFPTWMPSSRLTRRCMGISLSSCSTRYKSLMGGRNLHADLLTRNIEYISLVATPRC